MSYKSPIDIIYGDIQTKIEGDIVKAIQGCNIDIDKDELIKALNYDRNQYSKGYEDGVNNVLEKIRAEILDEAEYAYADFDRYKEDILYAEPDELPDDDFRYGLRRAIEIIDKYKEVEE